MRKLIFILLFLFLSLPVLAIEQTTLADFAKANGAYRDGKYAEAIAGYERILSLKIESGAVFYNLGNSYFKNKEPGKAVLNYERAQKLMPRDADLRSNLKFVLSSGALKVGPVESFMDKLLGAHVQFYTVNEMVLILALLAGLLAVAHLCGLYLNWTPSRWVMALLGLVFLVFVTGFVMKVKLETDAAIMIKSTQARFEPSDKATVYFELPEGQKVYFRAREDNWIKVQRPDGKIGWVVFEAAEKI